MNLRINGQELRFRISKEELESLCSGSIVSQSTILPNSKKIEAQIIPNNSDDTMNLSDKNNIIILNVSKNLTQKFYDSLPSKEGLEKIQKIDDTNSITLFLEVDIRTQKRKKD